MERDLDRDFLARLELEEIDVEQLPMPRVDLNPVDQNAVHVLAVDLQFDDGIGVDGSADVFELVRIQRDRDRIDAVTENDCRDAAGLA
jgi:hypothetical protein